MNALQLVKEDCEYCFRMLDWHLNGSEDPEPEYQVQEGVDYNKAGLFVTWKENGRLLGCIGKLDPVKVNEELGEYAIISATQDPRFDPISRMNPDLEVTVSHLQDMALCSNLYDWNIGEHGLVFEAQYQGVKYRSTYLPEVAEEQMWTKEITLYQLAVKSKLTRVYAQLSAENVRNWLTFGLGIVLRRYISVKASMLLKEAVL